jgi:DNA-binding NtrC family response regulator
VSRPTGETTAPVGSSPPQDEGVLTCMALVIVWSASEPHRVGEVAFFPFGVPLYVGRGGAEVEPLACFGRQRPGELLALDPGGGQLRGATISRRQLLVLSNGIELEMKVVGGCPTHVNGTERKQATLRPGDTVLLEQGALLLCVQRPKTLPCPHGRELHPFGQPDQGGIVGEGPRIWQLRKEIEFAAGMDDHVLIQGESGAGKELAAAAVHRLSERANGPFVPRNASTFTEALAASELFGNPANYPNVGMPARKGLVGEADRGTLFLDEIGECSEEVQTKLLRVMDHGEYQAVGESTVRRADVRIVGATNRDDGFGRGDFLARFPVRVHVPPLRERREDIPLLIRHLLLARASRLPQVRERFLRQAPDGRLEPKISARLVDHLVRHPLPRNTRELDAILVRSIQTSRGDELELPPAEKRSGMRSLLASPSVPGGPVALGGPPPKEEVMACLEGARGNVSRAAKALGVKRITVYRLMKRYGIEMKMKKKKTEPSD